MSQFLTKAQLLNIAPTGCSCMCCRKFHKEIWFCFQRIFYVISLYMSCKITLVRVSLVAIFTRKSLFGFRRIFNVFSVHMFCKAILVLVCFFAIFARKTCFGFRRIFFVISLYMSCKAILVLVSFVANFTRKSLFCFRRIFNVMIPNTQSGLNWTSISALISFSNFSNFSKNEKIFSIKFKYAFQIFAKKISINFN